MRKIVDWLEAHREYGMVFIRFIIGFHLVYGTVDNVTSWHRMLEFRDFLASNGTPWPLTAAVVSAWAQFICGLLFIAGAAVRPAAAVMVVNFVCALLIAHRSGGYPPAALALIMLFSSIGLMVHGAGSLSIDYGRRRAGLDANARGAGRADGRSGLL